MTSRASERRGSPRVRTARSLRARLSLEAEVLFLSARGMMVRLPFAPTFGARQGFGLVIEGDAVDVEGIVRNIALENEEDGTYHVGVEFVDMPPELETRLERFVARRLRSH
jgi:c-di-GMP-binding flagellar brake protein YcgR